MIDYIIVNEGNHFTFRILEKENPDDRGTLIAKSEPFITRALAVKKVKEIIHNLRYRGTDISISAIQVLKIFKANDEATAPNNYEFTRERIENLGLGFVEMHLETFNLIGAVKLEHDMEEPIDLNLKEGTRYFSKFANIANNKAIAVKIDFEQTLVRFSIVDISQDGQATPDPEFKISEIYVKPLIEVGGVG